MDRWTPAALEAYRTCPRLHAFRYVERVPLGPSSVAPWADAVRSAVAAYDASGHPADLWGELRRRWPAGSTDGWPRAVGACGRRLTSAPAPAAAAGLAFEADLGGTVVAGRADRIDRAAGGAILVAYRIDGVGPSPRQMLWAAAALGVESLGVAPRGASTRPPIGRPVVGVRVEDLDDGSADERAVGAEDRAAALAEARAIAAEAAMDRARRPRAGPHCAACAYALLCPAVGGLDPRRTGRDLLVLHRATRAAATAGLADVVRIVAESAGAIAGAGVTVIRRDGDGLVEADGRRRIAGDGLARILAGADPARASVRRDGETIEVAPGGDLLLPLGPAGLLVVPSAPAEAEAGLALLARTAAWAAAAADERRRASTDALTGLPNRGAFDAALGEALAAGAPFSLAILDIDRFKAINDSRGHRAGDAALRTVARVLAAAPGPAHRIGGEEFGLLLAGGAGEAAAAAEALRAAIRGTPVVHDGESFGITASIGLARLGAPPAGDGATYSDILAAADAALYRAKAGGRDRVSAAWETG